MARMTRLIAVAVVVAGVAFPSAPSAAAVDIAVAAVSQDAAAVLPATVPRRFAAPFLPWAASVLWAHRGSAPIATQLLRE